MNRIDIEAQFKRTGEKRYGYFIKTIVKTEEIFGLADEEGWTMINEAEVDNDVIAVFPYPEFAEAFRDAIGFDDNHVEVLDLSEFMMWLTDFEEKNIKVAVFPNLEFQGAVIDARRLRDDILAEFEKEKD